MGLLRAILTAPAVAPVRFADWTARQVLEAAEREVYDPSRIRQRLAELSERFDRGELSADEFDRLEDELLDELEEAERYQGLR
ncbi:MULTISPECIES: gas vesicle protein GvpG [Nocardiopsis]|jgi:hypothetical protein|uniref:Gas vesicle protein GvpG n=1 Tax=Nocardiopsis tropica TaxID=109330 RepID=A0ABU7KSU4_9ACTN|nr:gas vesicle protein GvpG [Nocardiopsis umidischolae]MEE2052147.1 gas vesicle protein GvpG [Nocardiopsis umidischolae]